VSRQRRAVGIGHHRRDTGRRPHRNIGAAARDVNPGGIRGDSEAQACGRDTRRPADPRLLRPRWRLGRDME
jgi:hypothetical protein